MKVAGLGQCSLDYLFIVDSFSLKDLVNAAYLGYNVNPFPMGHRP